MAKPNVAPLKRITRSKQPLAVALAEKFAWEVFLTDKWDHLFASHNMPLPRKIASFCVTSKAWCRGQQLDGDERLVHFEENSMHTEVTVGMRPGKGPFEVSGAWYPNSIAMYVPFIYKGDVERFGGTHLVTEAIRVVYKD